GALLKRGPAEPVVDPTARLASLKSGQLDFIERVNPSDMPALKGDPKVKAAKIVEIGYQGSTINIGKSEESQKTALGKDPRVREAFELSLDREAIVRAPLHGGGGGANRG